MSATTTRVAKLEAAKQAAKDAPPVARSGGSQFSQQQLEDWAILLHENAKLTHQDGIPERPRNGRKSWESKYNRSAYGLIDVQSAMIRAGLLAPPNTGGGKISRQVSIRQSQSDGTCTMYLLTVRS